MTTELPGRNGQVIVDGQFTSAKAQRVIAAIKEYDPHIEVGWIPPPARRVDEQGNKEPAFRISMEEPGKEPYVIFYVKDEDEFDIRVLFRIIQGDQRVNKVSISDIEAREQALKLIARQHWLEQLEAMNDIAFHAFKSPLHDYKINKDFRIKEGIPYNAAHLDDRNVPIIGAPKPRLEDI